MTFFSKILYTLKVKSKKQDFIWNENLHAGIFNKIEKFTETI